MPPFSLMGSIPGTSPVSAMDKPCVESFTASNDSITFHLLPVANARLRRVITIQRGQRIVIGRSSHDVSKGLSVKADNALFDCPVVSRKHAELLWRESEEGSDIAIIDASSSHGTFINGKKLEHNKEHVLKSGDEIRLGCEINSNLGAHEGVTFNLVRVGQSNASEHAEDNTRRGFRLYGDEDSEIDSVVDDDDDDDSSVVMESAGFSNNTTPDTKAIPKTATLGSQNQPIDLEQPNLILRKVVDIDDVDVEVNSAPKPPAADLESRGSRKPSSYACQPYLNWCGTALLNGSGNNEFHVGAHFTEDWYTELKSIASNAESESEDEDDEEDDRGSDMGNPLGYAEPIAKSSRSDVVSEPYSDDEGPELMSSKKQASPELGVDNSKGPAMKPSDASYIPPRTLHYDPVRGSQPPEPVELVSRENHPKPDYAYGMSNRCEFAVPRSDLGPTVGWNVGLTQDEASLFSEQTPFFFPGAACRPRRVETPYPSGHDTALQSQYYPYSSSNMVHGTHDQPSGGSVNAVFDYPAEQSASIQASTSQLAVPLNYAAQPSDSNITPDSQAGKFDENMNSKKRKAADMSQDEPAQVLSYTDRASLPAEESDVLVDGQALQEKIPTPATLQQPTIVNVIVEQQPAKRARNVADVARSVVKTASKVIGYTALGGVATAYFLQTPAAEALCEWL